MRVEDIFQTVTNLRVRSFCQRVANQTSLRVVFIDGSPHFLFFCRRISLIVEAEKLCSGLAEGARVNIIKKCVITRDEEAVVGVLRVEIDIEAQLFNTPVQHVHGLVNQCGEGY